MVIITVVFDFEISDKIIDEQNVAIQWKKNLGSGDRFTSYFSLN